MIAYAYAAAYPAEVKKLILIDPSGYPNPDAKGALAFKFARIPGIRNFFKILSPRNIVYKSLEDVYGNDKLVNDSLVEIYRDMTIREGNRAAMLKRINMDYAPDTTIIKKVKMPTLVIWGDLDQVIPVSHAYRFQRDLPDNKLVVLKGVGHIGMEESPNIVAPMVNDFLR
jgi:pimeloyl-ACP methyl ester carboxylesterase